ncbi:Uncharacterized protein TCM_035458 [Theobroma cacao]|uniref:Uncharacterized protein n=1 Tax=Theobroma cacao TaxID=3641 RepID=A0A061FIB3_THECC|nr:Uncharacterized protein TCM_035458 [Theobroma cacao]
MHKVVNKHLYFYLQNICKEKMREFVSRILVPLSLVVGSILLQPITWVLPPTRGLRKHYASFPLNSSTSTFRCMNNQLIT